MAADPELKLPELKSPNDPPEPKEFEPNEPNDPKSKLLDGPLPTLVSVTLFTVVGATFD